MKKVSYIITLFFLFSCTSNTIFKPPKDLIPKDTMSLLIQEMMIASSAKHVKNKDLQRNLNYMPFVYTMFKIDSTRFKNSNFYYTSKIDLYEEILTDAKVNLEKRKDVYLKINATLDSIRKDSVKRNKKPKKIIDSLIVGSNQ